MMYEYKEGAVQQFTIGAFRFVLEQSEVVHLHCQVEACREGDNTTKCHQGCSEGRKRRALELDAAEGQVMTVGPLVLTAPQNAQQGQCFKESIKERHDENSGRKERKKESNIQQTNLVQRRSRKETKIETKKER